MTRISKEEQKCQKKKNGMITLKSDLEIKHNVDNVSNAQNELESKLSQSTE